MQEIDVENDLGVRIFINGVPDHELIIADEASGFLQALELEISKHYKIKDKE